MHNEKPTVLACVKGQPDCDRIINKARLIAESGNYELKILSIFSPAAEYGNAGKQIEYLHGVAKANNADMTVLFSKNAPRTASRFASENNATHIVTGMHNGKDTGFLVKFNELAPYVSITMVSKSNKTYTMELSKTYNSFNDFI